MTGTPIGDEVAEFMRHLAHPHLFRHDAPQPPATCGQCQDGVVPANGCTCGDGLPPYGHEPGCGFEPCPNGCWDILHAHGAPQPAAAPQPAIIATDTPEEPMSFVDTLEADARALVAKFETVDRAALDALEAVQGNPETAAVFSVLASLTRLPLTPGVLTTAIDVLKMTLERASTQPAAVPQATGPVIAGQA